MSYHLVLGLASAVGCFLCAIAFDRAERGHGRWASTNASDWRVLSAMYAVLFGGNMFLASLGGAA